MFGHVGTQVRIYRSSALIGCRARQLEWDISSDETAKNIQYKNLDLLEYGVCIFSRFISLIGTLRADSNNFDIWKIFILFNKII